MAETVVSILIERLATSIEQKVNQLQGVSDELICIKNELQIIRAVLRDADARSQTDEAVKEWVNQVRDIAQEIENILDEHAAETQGSCMGRIAKFCKCVESSSDYNLAPRIQAIKARIEWLSDCRQRYNLSNSEQQNSTSSSHRSGASMRDPREDALFLVDSQVVGIAGPRDKLITFLLDEDPRLRVVSVYGMGGLGKTTLAKKVYDNQKMRYRFPDHRAWITVSQSFEPNSLLRSLLKQLLSFTEGVDRMDAMEMKQTLYDKLLGKRYVVVLDDIWNSNAWKGLKNALPDDNTGSRIIVTTRFQSIAAETCIAAYDLQYKQEPLNLEDSWKLFYKKAFRSDLENMTFDPDQISGDPCSKFLNKCGGLPLGIVTIGGLLSTKRPSEWDQVYQSLGSFMDESNRSALEDLRLVISYSYNDLPYHLKSCFLYMSIFPEDYSIQCSRLLRLWAAEGFVVEERRPTIGLTKEEIAYSYLEELIQRSLIQVEGRNSRGKISRCNVHDLIREFVIGIAMNENFAAFIAEGQKTPHSSRQPPKRLAYGTEVLEGSSESDFLQRSLFLFQGCQSSFNFSRFKFLKVLDVEGMSNFSNGIGDLNNLRYLRLRPDFSYEPWFSTSKLVHLETLDLKETSLSLIDLAGIVNMTELHNLLVGHSWGIHVIEMPSGIHKLTALEKLGVFKLAKEGNGLCVKDLGNMTQLRKLAVSYVREEDVMELFASVGKMKFLSTFKVSSGFLHSASLSSPSTSLRCLSMAGALNSLPSWISSLPNLEKLLLEDSKLECDPMEALEKLPNLVTLTLCNAFDGEKLSISKGGFPNLEKLSLKYLDNLTELRVNSGGMPAIQSITFVTETVPFEVLPLRMDYRTNMPEIKSFSSPRMSVEEGLGRVLLARRGDFRLFRRALH